MMRVNQNQNPDVNSVEENNLPDLRLAQYRCYPSQQKCTTSENFSEFELNSIDQRNIKKITDRLEQKPHFNSSERWFQGGADYETIKIALPKAKMELFYTNDPSKKPGERKSIEIRHERGGVPLAVVWLNDIKGKPSMPLQVESNGLTRQDFQSLLRQAAEKISR